MEPLIFPNKEGSLLRDSIGILITIATCALLLFMCTGGLYSPKIYYNRKALYKWLKQNPLPNPSFDNVHTYWMLPGGFKIVLWNDDNTWHIPIEVSSQTTDLIDKWRYRKIRNLLHASIQDYVMDNKDKELAAYVIQRLNAC